MHSGLFVLVGCESSSRQPSETRQMEPNRVQTPEQDGATDYPRSGNAQDGDVHSESEEEAIAAIEAHGGSVGLLRNVFSYEGEGLME